MVTEGSIQEDLSERERTVTQENEVKTLKPAASKRMSINI
jgi:hypothetical protein